MTAPKTGQLGLVINHFKGAMTRYANEHHIPFKWQVNYWANILNDQTAFDRVTRYIANNIAKWHEDRFYKTNDTSNPSPK